MLQTDVALVGLGKFALPIRTCNSLRSGLFFKGSRWKLIPLLESLGVLFEQPSTAHLTILELMLSSRNSFFSKCTQWCHAMRPSLRHGFQNGGFSNCPVIQLSAVTIRLKGEFTSQNIAIYLRRIMCFRKNDFFKKLCFCLQFSVKQELLLTSIIFPA